MTWGSDMSNTQQQTPQSYVTATPEPAVMRAIENLSYEWARSIDENRLEDLAGLLTEQCDYKIASRFNTDRGLPLAIVHIRSRSQMRDRITSLRLANIYESHHFRHMVSGLQVIGKTTEGWEVRANYSVIRTMEHNGAMEIFSCGQYRDEVVFEGQTPLLHRRHVLFDSRAIATLLAYPL